MQNRLCAAALLTTTLLAAPAAAQTTASNDFNLSAAAIYDLVLNERNLTSNLGAHFDVAKWFLEGDKLNVSAVGEFGWNHFEFTDVTSFGGGLRFATRSRQKHSVFGQFLLGGEHVSSNTAFMIQPGGGVDFAWKPRYAVRVQVDWRHLFSDFDDQDGMRIGVGLVFPLSR